MTGRLEGKVALITGAGIVALDIDPKALWQTEAAVTGAGGRIVTCETDVGEEAAVAAAVEAGWERFGRLDVLYNNAGVLAHEPHGC